MLGQILASLRWFASRRQLQPMHERKRDHGEGKPGAWDRRAQQPIRRLDLSKPKLRVERGREHPQRRNQLDVVMNVKAAARGGSDSGGGEQSDERGPFSFLLVPKTAV